jgi:hypothetical protein
MAIMENEKKSWIFKGKKWIIINSTVLFPVVYWLIMLNETNKLTTFS